MALSSFAPPSHTEEGEYVFSVGELNRTVRDFLEQHFSTIWVCGEISNLSCPVSGHLYFTLKDEQGQIRCAFFRNRHIRAMPALKNGQRVLVNAKLSVYPERGDYQLIIESLQDAGEGLLQQQFEALKKKLLAEGLFDPARKRPLPKFIQTLGVITSSTGAALQDVLSVLKRRFALVKVIVYCAQVQGAEAPKQLIAALKQANTENRCEVILLTRGGGSLEDLSAFNDENLARAIAASRLPTVSAVGHEIDFTIADFVADVRAPTPSAAAEMLSQHGEDVMNRLHHIQKYLIQNLNSQLDQGVRTLTHLQKRLKDPRQQLQQKYQHLDFLWSIVHKNIHRILTQNQYEFLSLFERLRQQNPQLKIFRFKEHLRFLEQGLKHGFKTEILNAQLKLFSLTEKLEAYSPLKTLSRGFAIVEFAEKQSLVTEANQVNPGDKIRVRLKQDGLLCTVDEKREF